MRKKGNISAVLFSVMLAVITAGGCAGAAGNGREAGKVETTAETPALEKTVMAKESVMAEEAVLAEETGKDYSGDGDASGIHMQEVNAGNTAAKATATAKEVVTVKDTVLPGSEGLKESSKFVLLAEAVPDVIQEIRYYSTYNFVGDRIDGYEEPCAILTREAAGALKEVSDDVAAKGYRLKVYDAYRPQMAVDHFARWAADVGDTRMKPYFYPDLDKAVLFDQGYIGRKSGHSRGSTVDLTLFDMKTGKEVDMGGTFDYFGQRSHPDFKGDLTEEQVNNRRILREAMMSHGFKPLSTEWWHFTLEQEPYPNTYFTFPVSSSWYMAE